MILDTVITQLVKVLDAATTSPVYDSTSNQAVDEWTAVIVGGGLDPLEPEESARATLTESPMGNHWTEESGSVDCVAYSSSSNSYAECRPVALALAETCRAAVHADPTLGGLLVMAGQAEVSELGLVSVLDVKGFTSVVRFTVSYTTTYTN